MSTSPASDLGVGHVAVLSSFGALSVSAFMQPPWLSEA